MENTWSNNSDHTQVSTSSLLRSRIGQKIPLKSNNKTTIVGHLGKQIIKPQTVGVVLSNTVFIPVPLSLSVIGLSVNDPC